MKVQFEKKMQKVGDTLDKSDYIANHITSQFRDGISTYDMEKLLFADFKQKAPAKINNTILVESVESIKLEFVKRQKTGEAEWLPGVQDVYEYKLFYTLVSVIYDCLNVTGENNYNLIDPSNNKVFLFEAKDVDVFVIK